MIVGNSALIKCEIPSFVADFVSVVSWVENNGLEYFPNHIGILYLFFSVGRHKQLLYILKIFLNYVFGFLASLVNNVY